MKKSLSKRFIEYVKIDTQSDENSSSVPSTKKQFDLAKVLVSQLEEIGMDTIELDDFCYVYAHLKSNIPTDHPGYGRFPKIGLIAHLDTAPGTTGANVNPRIIEEYQGGDIQLDDSLSLTLKENPALKESMGHTLVTTDGTTLLGADDKAGIAIIMTALDELKKSKSILHPDIRVAFTPDEEIGRGATHFDLKKFDADFAYTVDGGPAGEINKETFSADSAQIHITGRDTHPGEAKNIMVSAIQAAARIISQLPADMLPETTEKRQPFIHPYNLQGTVGNASIKCLLRAFDTQPLAHEKEILNSIISNVKKEYPGVDISLDITQTYRNMGDVLDTVSHVTDHLELAVKNTGLTPKWVPVRGGTDGSGLTAMELPCPNIFTGGHNYHSPLEWISLDIMKKSVQTLLNLVQIWVNET